MPLVEKRYAEALINVSAKAGSIDRYQNELAYITNLFTTQDVLRSFLLNPEVKADIKKDSIKKLFTGNVGTEIVNFLLLLLDKSRLKVLPGILKEYIVLADRYKNILSMKIFAAAPLDDAQLASVTEKYRQLYNAAQVKTEVVIDSSVIGGIKIQIGDRVIDGTVKGRLEGLRKALVEA